MWPDRMEGLSILLLSQLPPPTRNAPLQQQGPFAGELERQTSLKAEIAQTNNKTAQRLLEATCVWDEAIFTIPAALMAIYLLYAAFQLSNRQTDISERRGLLKWKIPESLILAAIGGMQVLEIVRLKNADHGLGALPCDFDLAQTVRKLNRRQYFALFCSSRPYYRGCRIGNRICGH
jgi:hypothetical protein